MPYSKKRSRHSAFGSSKKGAMKKKRRSAKPTLSRKVARLQSQVRSVRDLAEQGTGVKTYRERFTYTIDATPVNTVEYLVTNLCGLTSIVRAVTSMNFFDPSTPGTLTIADGNTGSYQREYLFDPSFKYTVRNNSNNPCTVRSYLCLPKNMTGNSPLTLMEAGFSDKGSGLNNSPLAYPTDSDVLLQMWRIHQSHIKYLQPGQQFTVSYKHSDFKYDPSFVDTEAFNYQPQLCGASILWRVEGCLVHDNVDTSLVGWNRSKVDISTQSTYKISYDAGSNISYIEVFDDSDTVTDTAIVANKPKAALQGFSVI